VGGGSGEEGGELGGEEDNGVEGEKSAIIGNEGGSIGTEGGVSGKSRKDIAACCVVNDQPVGNPKRKV
jgi:hypothetical protein